MVPKYILEYWVTKDKVVKDYPKLELNLHNAEFYMTKGSVPGSSLSLQEYRKFIIAKFLIRAYQVCGFRIVDKDGFKSLPDSFMVDENEHCIKIREFSVEGDVDYFRQDVRIGQVECEAKLKFGKRIYRLYKSRAEECKRINASVQDADSRVPIRKIVGVVVHWEFLSRSPSEAITINVNKANEVDHGSRALFYNYNRITSVILTFEKRVQDGIYPELPTCQQVWDNDSPNGDKETMILECLRLWPSVLQKTVTTSDPSNVTHFITKLNEACDAYYFATHVLVPSDAKHLFRDMFKRIYVYKGIHNLMVACFSILFLD